jgi:3-hydroxyacyl-CoA dehydrogenase
VVWVEESVFEKVEIKREIFKEIDEGRQRIAGGIEASRFASSESGKAERFTSIVDSP